MALQEPLVDVVDRNQVVTSPALIKEIDIQTCTKDDIPFDSPFTLQIKRNDYAQASYRKIDSPWMAARVSALENEWLQTRTLLLENTIILQGNGLKISLGSLVLLRAHFGCLVCSTDQNFSYFPIAEVLLQCCQSRIVPPALQPLTVGSEI